MIGAISKQQYEELQQRIKQGLTHIKKHHPENTSVCFAELRTKDCQELLWQLVRQASTQAQYFPKPKQQETFEWPKKQFVGGGKKPNEDPDEYIIRMREILYPKKKGGRRKKSVPTNTNSYSLF